MITTIYANIEVLSEKSDYFAAIFRFKVRESIERIVRRPDCSKAAFLKSLLGSLHMDGFSTSTDDKMELWILLADIR